MFIDYKLNIDLDNYDKKLWFIDYSKILDIDTLPGEVWKDIGVIKGVDFRGQYRVSNLGRVKSCGYTSHYKSNGYYKRYYTRKEKILKQNINRQGYYHVSLCKKGYKQKTVRVHKLVGEYFLCNNNPTNETDINHIDENKLNNCEYNLEWCTHLYNMRYGTRTKKTKKPILQFDLDGNFIKRWDSIIDAEQEGFKRSGICLCCNNKIKKHHGFVWVYEKNI